jgi:hypothetical protein
MGIGIDGKYHSAKLIDSDQFEVEEVNVPSAGAAAVITLPARGTDLANVITGVAYSYDAAPTAGGLTIADGSDTVFSLDITAGGENVILWSPPRKGKPNRAMVITLLDGGSVQGKLNVMGSWIEHSPMVGQFLFNDPLESGLIPLFF